MTLPILHFPGICAPYETPKGFKHLTDSLYLNKWVVHAKEPIKQAEYVLEYCRQICANDIIRVPN